MDSNTSSTQFQEENNKIVFLILSALSFLVSLPGVIVNIIILMFTFYPKMGITGEYKYFLANLAFSDTQFCLTNMFSQIRYLFGTSELKSSDVSCKMTGWFEIWSITSMMTSLGLVSLNRYVNIFHQNLYPKIFSHKSCVFICLLVQGLGILVAFASIYHIEVKYQLYCAYNSDFILPVNETSILMQVFHSTANLTNQLFVGLTYVIIIICNARLYFKLKTHGKKVLSIIQKDRHKENIALMHATIAQAAVPLICIIPIFIALNIITALKTLSPYMVDAASNVAFLIFFFNPLFDGIITLKMVVPYKKALKKCYESIVSSHKNTTNSAPVILFTASKQLADKDNG